MLSILLTLARACAAKGYCSRSVGRSVGVHVSVGLCVGLFPRFVGVSVGVSVGLCVGLFLRFLSNRGCCRYQTWICGYVQRALGTARVRNVVVKEQRVYGGEAKIYTVASFPGSPPPPLARAIIA